MSQQTLQNLRTLLASYDPWANRRCLEMLRATPAAAERGRRVLAHTVITPQVWLCRIEGRRYPTTDFWPEFSLERCGQEIETTLGQLAGFFAGLEATDLERVVAYTNSKGDRFETPVGEILTHVAMHGGYHRGQIATAVREAGGTPLNTDYIVFSRSR